MRIAKAGLLVTALLLGSCSSADETVLSDQSVYAVFEVTPISGRVMDGERLGAVRVVVLDLVRERGRGMPIEDFSSRCPPGVCEPLAARRGADVLRNVMEGTLNHEALSTWEVGTERRLSGSYLGFENFTGTGFLRLRAEEAKPAEAVVKLVKKCNAKVLSVRQSSYRNGGSGVIAVPAKVTNAWAEVRRPTCYAKTDFDHELLSQDEIAAAERKKAEQRAREEAYLQEWRVKDAQRKQDERAYRDERFAAIRAKGDAWVKAHPLTSAQRALLSELERRAYPELAALMAGGELSEVRIENHCIARGWLGKSSDGRCKQHADLLRLRWKNGTGVFIRHPKNSDRARYLRSATFEEEAGFVQITRGPDAELSIQATVEAIQEVLTFAAREIRDPSDPDPRRLPLPENWSLVSPRD